MVRGAARMNLPGAARRMARALPAPLRGLLGDAWRGLGRAAFRRRLGRLDLRALQGEPRLNYGFVLPREPGAVIHGGRVKLVHLDCRYPEQEERFNLLYLVSSAMPAYAADLIRAAKSGGVRLVWNQNGVAYPAWAGPGHERTNAPMRECYGLADFVVFQSDFCRRSALRWLGPSTAPFEIIHNCVDTDVFRPAPETGDDAICRLLLAGTHQAAYRVKSALACLAALSRQGFAARLTVAGKCDWPGGAEEAARIAGELGVAHLVSFAPPFRQDEAPALYQAHHILLHTKYNDPCPTVPIEAMACGLPVVASRSGGLPELLGEEGGVLLFVPADDYERDHAPPSEDMAQAVMDMWPNLSERGQAARTRAVERFSATDWLARHEVFFERLLAGGTRS